MLAPSPRHIYIDYIHVCVCECVSVSVSVCMHTHACVCVCVCVYKYMYIYTHTHTHAQTHTHTHFFDIYDTYIIYIYMRLGEGASPDATTYVSSSYFMCPQVNEYERKHVSTPKTTYADTCGRMLANADVC